MAHRQSWFDGNIVKLNQGTKFNLEKEFRTRDGEKYSRYMDNSGDNRFQIALINLINLENKRNQEFVDAYESGNPNYGAILRKNKSPLNLVNELLKSSNLSIEIFVQDYRFVFAKKNNGRAFKVNELSDGERNVLQMGLEVLTADPDTLFLIDEPELHLHRSIISPFLFTLFEMRDDCSFIVSTHDVQLPIIKPDSRILLIRKCQGLEGNQTQWDTDLIESADNIPNDLKSLILGAKRTILFVEGNFDSLDRKIYEILFPGISIVPQGNCSEVEKAVKGIRESESLHWINAYGLIDSDNRTENELNAKRDNYIYALPFYSVESIYYHSRIVKAIAKRQSGQIEANPDLLEEEANWAGMEVLKREKERLCKMIAIGKIRQEVTEKLPTLNDLKQKPTWEAKLNFDEFVTNEILKFEKMVETNDLNGLINRYPIKETSALNEISKKLKYPDRKTYEGAVRQMLRDDETVLEAIQDLFGDLIQKLKCDEGSN